MDHPPPQPPRHPTERLVGTCPAIAALRTQLRHLAAFDTLGNPAVPTVLLQGETGTGKGLVARVLHDSGARAQGPFLDVNCAAIPETLLEAELFGVTAGAFTDARRAKSGLFEAAVGGTLFLDEIDALPLAVQGKLLTAIETKRVRRVGAVREQAVDVKVTADRNPHGGTMQSMYLSAFSKGQHMADKHFEIDLPEEVLAGFGWHDTEVPHKVREALVMALLRLDQLSEAQAAALLHVDRWDLLETMGRYRIPAVRLSQDELRRELTQELRRGGTV